MATDVIREFANDGVKYLELRSTPREEKHTGKDVHMKSNVLIGFLLSGLFYQIIMPTRLLSFS